jgi:hypothetical protein
MASTLHFGGDVMSDYREGYRAGFADGILAAQRGFDSLPMDYEDTMTDRVTVRRSSKPKKSRKLSKWQKFVKKYSKNPRYRYVSGKKRGMVNMKKIAAEWKRQKKKK